MSAMYVTMYHHASGLGPEKPWACDSWFCGAEAPGYGHDTRSY